MSKSKDWVDNTFWPVMGLVALTPAYFAIRATLHHITYRTCTYEKHPLLLQAYGYMSYAVISVVYFCFIALMLAGIFKGGQGLVGVYRNSRSRSRFHIYNTEKERKELQPLLKPIQDRVPDLDLKVKPYSIMFLLLHILVKFLRFWPAALFSLAVTPIFACVVLVCSGFAGGIGAAYWLHEELCLPKLPLWIAGLSVLGVGIFFASNIGTWLSVQSSGGLLCERVWKRIFGTPPRIQKRLQSSPAGQTWQYLRNKLINSISHDTSTRLYKTNVNGCSFSTSAKEVPRTTVTQAYDFSSRTLHIYASQGKAKSIVFYARVRLPWRESLDTSTEAVALTLVSEFSPLSLLLRTATAVSKGGQA